MKSTRRRFWITIQSWNVPPFYVFLRIACYLLLDSALKQLPQFLVPFSAPLDLLPVDFLCSCVSLSIQLQTLPFAMIIGLKWMTDTILGCESLHKDELAPYCASNCLEQLREMCTPYSTFRLSSCFAVSVIDGMLHGPVWREYQAYQSVCRASSSLQSFLFHKSEEEAHLPTSFMQPPWTTLAMKTPSLYRFSMLLLLHPPLLLTEAQKSSIILITMLADV